MLKSEKEQIIAKLRRAAIAMRSDHSGNLYHDGMAQGMDKAAGIIGKIPAENEIEPKDNWSAEKKENLYIEEGFVYRLTCPYCGECFIVTFQALQRERFCRWCGKRVENEFGR